MAVVLGRSRRAALDADFDQWVVVTSPALTRYAHAVTGSRSLGEELAQEALVRVYTRWESVRDHPAPEAYARKIVSNLYLTWWRRIGRREVTTCQRDTTPVELDPLDTRASLWQACLDLAPRQRAAIVLRFYEDLSFEEVGQIMGTTSSTARSQVTRALQSLREMMIDLETDRDG